MKYCNNPDCRHWRRTGSAAEYRDEVDVCADCGSQLALQKLEVREDDDPIGVSAYELTSQVGDIELSDTAHQKPTQVIMDGRGSVGSAASLSVWKAIFVTIGIIVAAFVLSTIVAVTTMVIMMAGGNNEVQALAAAGMFGGLAAYSLIMATALWAGIDARAMELRKAASGLRSRPVLRPLAVFVLCAGLWIVGFPWYLATRGSWLVNAISGRSTGGEQHALEKDGTRLGVLDVARSEGRFVSGSFRAEEPFSRYAREFETLDDLLRSGDDRAATELDRLNGMGFSVRNLQTGQGVAVHDLQIDRDGQFELTLEREPIQSSA